MSDDKCDGQNKITVSIINQDTVNGLTEEYNKITGDEPVNNAERYNLIKQVSANMKICNENVQDIDAKSPEISETGKDDVEELHQLYPENKDEIKMQDNPMRRTGETRRKLTIPGGTFRRKNKRKGNKSAKKQKKTKRRYNKK
jgi:hypothetical protein